MIESIFNTLLELSPWFLIGMAVAGVLHVVLPRDFVRRQLRGRMGVMKAVALGVPLPLCSCGVIPAGLGLKEDGASDGASLGFLISTPQTGVDSILVSASFLGWPFALFKVLAATVTGLIGGWVADRVASSSDLSAIEKLGADNFHSVGEGGTAVDASETRGPSAMLSHAHSLLASIWRWLVFGVLISALIDTFLPLGTLRVFAELGSIGAGLAVLLVSLPLYVCATASVPIAAAMVANGMPVGAALVFLMAGPATNVATIGAIYRGFGRAQLGVYLGVLVVGSILFGAVFDSAVGPLEVISSEHGPHTVTWWALGSTIVLVGLITRLALLDFSKFLRTRWNGLGEDEVEIDIRGMTCGGCVEVLEAALLEIDGVIAAVVSRNPDRARVRGAIDRTTIDNAIVEAGYHPVSS